MLCIKKLSGKMPKNHRAMIRYIGFLPSSKLCNRIRIITHIMSNSVEKVSLWARESMKESAKMKKIFLTILNALLITPFLIFFRRGGIVAIFMLPVWFVMSIVNTVCSKDVKQLLIYNGWLSLFASVGIFVCGQLYFKYVCWDSIGETIILLEIAVEVIYISILTGVEPVVRYLINKKTK